MTLTKNGLVEILWNNIDLSRRECRELMESCFEIIKDELAQGNKVMISGFGKWQVKSKNGRQGRNPKTGKSLILHDRKVIRFHPSPRLRCEINGTDSRDQELA